MTTGETLANKSKRDHKSLTQLIHLESWHILCVNQRIRGSAMKTFILISLLFGLNIVFAGCDERDRQPGTRTTPSPSTAPSTSKLSDSDLEKAVRAKLC